MKANKSENIDTFFLIKLFKLIKQIFGYKEVKPHESTCGYIILQIFYYCALYIKIFFCIYL